MAACDAQLAPGRTHEPGVVNSVFSRRSCNSSPGLNQTKDSWPQRVAHPARAMGTWMSTPWVEPALSRPRRTPRRPQSQMIWTAHNRYARSLAPFVIPQNFGSPPVSSVIAELSPSPAEASWRRFVRPRWLQKGLQYFGREILETPAHPVTSPDGYIAQSLERLTADQQVPGPNPGVPFVNAWLLVRW